MLNMLVFKIRRCPRLWYYPQFYLIRIRNGYIGYHHHKYEAFLGSSRKDDGTYISNVKFTQKKILYYSKSDKCLVSEIAASIRHLRLARSNSSYARSSRSRCVVKSYIVAKTALQQLPLSPLLAKVLLQNPNKHVVEKMWPNTTP